jgi:hypothetical protein
LRRIIAAEPSLLEARDNKGRTPLMTAAHECTACVSAVLELRANVGAVGVDGRSALAIACDMSSLENLRLLIAAGASCVDALPPASTQARFVAAAAVEMTLASETGCGVCSSRCGGPAPGSCAAAAEVLRCSRLACGRRSAQTGGRWGVPYIVTLRLWAHDASAHQRRARAGDPADAACRRHGRVGSKTR